MPTTATSHRSKATLQQVAQSHASSRTLSAEARATFAEIVNGATCDTIYPTLLNDAFFEAATSCATRAGQSMARRRMVSDLMALREAVYSGTSIAPSEYTLQVTVEGATAADVDLFERALRAFQHDGVTVVAVEGV